MCSRQTHGRSHSLQRCDGAPHQSKGEAHANAPRDGAGLTLFAYTSPPGRFNVCGQAAIATLADHTLPGEPLFGVDRTVCAADGLLHCDNDTLVRAVEARFPPNLAGGLLGTSRGQIARALRSTGLRVTQGCSGAFAAGWRSCWQRLRDAANAGTPVAVLVDAHLLGGSRLHGHWPVAWQLDERYVYLANLSDMPAVPVDLFLRAWACPSWSPGGIAYGFTHCYVFCEPPPLTPSAGQNP